MNSPIPSPDLFGWVDPGPALEPDLSSADAQSDSAWPRLLIDLRAVVAAALTRSGHDPGDAEAIAKTAVLALAGYAGGRQIYLPNGAKLRRSMRDIDIWRRFKGNNVGQLARDYGLTETAIYAILANQRKNRRSTR